MASIYERKDRGKIAVSWYDAKSGRRTKFFPLNQRRAARQFAAEADLSNTAMAVSRIDVETAITYFLEDRHAVRSPRTYERYKNILLQFLKYVCPDGHRRTLATVTPLVIEQWRNERQQRRSAWTIRVDLKIVRSFYAWCIKKGWAATNTAAMVDLPAPKRRFPHYLHPDQVNELLARLKLESPTEFYPIAVFAARAGLRRSEILFLRWEHVDLERKLILVHGKSKDPRAVPLHEEIRQFLLDWPQQDAAIFPAVYNVQSNVRSPAVTKRFSTWLKANGYVITLHGLRHSFATELASRGLSVVALMELMGHASLRTTQIYTHAMLQHSREYVERLGDPVSPGPSQSTYAPKPA